jgi:hypothetical protein
LEKYGRPSPKQKLRNAVNPANRLPEALRNPATIAGGIAMGLLDFSTLDAVRAGNKRRQARQGFAASLWLPARAEDPSGIVWDIGCSRRSWVVLGRSLAKRSAQKYAKAW